MVRPSRARSRVDTTEDTVSGTTLASCNGRVANLSRPPAAIYQSVAPPTPSTGSGAGASASVVHSYDIRLAPVTPSTAAWCTLVRTARRPSWWQSVPATPSITHISQSRRLRSNGSEAM